MQSENLLLAYLKNLTGDDRTKHWRGFVTSIGEMIQGDDVLRGGLAHTMLYLGSRNRPSNKKSKESVHRYTSSISDFSDKLFADPDKGCFIVETIEKQSIQQFIFRETKSHENSNIYALYVLFLIYTAAKDGFEFFFKHYIHKESEKISEFLMMIVKNFKDKTNIQTITGYVRDFSLEQIAQNQLKANLGGMIELGNFDSQSLWADIFEMEKINDVSAHESYEKYYVCYRFSSNKKLILLNKSFLVFQSPGRVRSNNKMRRHFAFKLFYRNNSGVTRYSSGAVLKLGSTISCFGSSEMLIDKDKVSPVNSTSGLKRSPKSIVFNFEVAAFPILFGSVITVNEELLPISSRIVAVNTLNDHSDKVGIGAHKVEDLSNELSDNASFASRKSKSQDILKEKWESILELLREQNTNGVTRSHLVRTFDTRGLF